MEDIDRIIEKSKQLFSEQKYEEAISILTNIRNKVAYNLSAEFELGKLYFVTKEYKKSINIFEQILKIKFDYNASIFLAKSYKETNELKKAIKVLLYAKKENLSRIQEKDVNDLLILIMCCFNHLELAIKFCCKLDKNKFSYDINKLYNDCLADMMNKNIGGLSLKKYSKVVNYVNDIKFKNAILNEYEIFEKETTLKSKPRRLRLTLTNKCNLKCKMCEVVNHKKQQISKDKLNNLLKLFPYLEDIIWMGGEVFLYPEFNSLIEYAHRFNIKQSLSTNGMLITKEMAEKLCKYNVDITFSIDSVIKSKYEYIREGANFDVLIEKLKLINSYNKNNIYLTMQYVLSQYNCDENLINVIKFASKYKFSKLVLVIDVNASNEIFNKIVCNYNNTKDKLQKLSTDLKIDIISYIPKLKSCDKNNELKTNNLENNCNIDRMYCMLPWKMITIDDDYSVRSDCFCEILGNIENNNILDIWNNKKFVDLRNNIKLNEKVCNPICYNSNRKFH